ncbi:anti-repressor SinI family protein [Neobacillus citreus]|uniref:Anti-repressor SinI family protein n=1 Tax=Neobacillus citreus TaxID=2833578 RepID=A0A942T774_9BACI|nr:anti-repressor SinI family protein [Neobacillus citreus]MCH6267140.1 anti-repressor SinI family protein [Neobacillus citreus]
MERKLDKEWVNLMIQAKQMGIPIEEIRRFLRQRSVAEVSQLENNNEASFASATDTLKH